MQLDIRVAPNRFYWVLPGFLSTYVERGGVEPLAVLAGGCDVYLVMSTDFESCDPYAAGTPDWGFYLDLTGWSEAG